MACVLLLTKIQKLQREIANRRGLSYERSLDSPTVESAENASKVADSPCTPEHEDNAVVASETKRKYRRHPKPDENAPQRSPSAYVLFSNKIRDDVRGQNLSFTEIAKLVGDRWQKLSPAEKDPYEAQAAAAKEKYNAELATYKKTDESKEYAQYLGDFKAKHGGSTSETKRPKLEQESSGGSLSTKSVEGTDDRMIASTHNRVGSFGTVASTTSYGTLPSPMSRSAYPGQGSVVSARLPPISPSTDLTNVAMLSRDSRSFATFSPQSSISEDTMATRDVGDPLPSAAQLSLLPGPPRLADQRLQSPTTASHPSLTTSHRRPVRVRTPLQEHQGSSGSAGSGSISLHSSMTTPDTAFMYPTSNAVGPTGESWPAQNAEAGMPSLPNHVMPYGAVSLPPLKASDRLPDVLQDQSQRLLPIPTPSPAHEHDQRLRNLARLPDLATSRPAESAGSVLSTPQDYKFPLESSESEAADALAGLAYSSRGRDSFGLTGK